MANLLTFDLNLLVMLEALISERHVTRAARRLGVTQPAMTSALNRVRAIFDDPLLVRTPAGMVPTPKALELLGPTREILLSIDHILDRQKHFDPLTSTRSFRVRVSGLMSAILLPDVVGRFRTLAPNARFEVVSLCQRRSDSRPSRRSKSRPAALGSGGYGEGPDRGPRHIRCRD